MNMTNPPLFIAETRNSPAVFFDHRAFRLDGISTMVDAMEFYGPLMALFDEVADPQSEEIDIEINLSYYNSSSNKCIYQLMEKVKRLSDKGVKINVCWCVEEEDEFMHEGGQTLEELLGLQFSYKQVPFNQNRLF
jgi:hypothetical protein